MTDKSCIYLFEGMFLYVGKSIQTQTHNSHALEIGISLDHPFHMQDDNGVRQESSCIMIAPDNRYECQVIVEGRWAHIGIEPESRLAKDLINNYIDEDSFVFLDHKVIPDFASTLKQLLVDSSGIDKMEDLLHDFFNQLLAHSLTRPEQSIELDYRIKKVIRILRESTEDKPSLRELAAQVELSGGRLVHLFKEQVGIPIRKYMLWVRVNRAVMELTSSKNLTDAAHNAGFADSAHFSRTFFRMFGVSPSEIFKNSQIVQASCSIV